SLSSKYAGVDDNKVTFMDLNNVLFSCENVKLQLIVSNLNMSRRKIVARKPRANKTPTSSKSMATVTPLSSTARFVPEEAQFLCCNLIGCVLTHRASQVSTQYPPPFDFNDHASTYNNHPFSDIRQKKQDLFQLLHTFNNSRKTAPVPLVLSTIIQFTKTLVALALAAKQKICTWSEERSPAFPDSLLKPIQPFKIGAIRTWSFTSFNHKTKTRSIHFPFASLEFFTVKVALNGDIIREFEFDYGSENDATISDASDDDAAVLHPSQALEIGLLV
ncbi:hypothetical protein KI387_029945, partial [Taxus chinensis]